MREESPNARRERNKLIWWIVVVFALASALALAGYYVYLRQSHLPSPVSQRGVRPSALRDAGPRPLSTPNVLPYLA